MIFAQGYEIVPLPVISHWDSAPRPSPAHVCADLIVPRSSHLTRALDSTHVGAPSRGRRFDWLPHKIDRRIWGVSTYARATYCFRERSYHYTNCTSVLWTQTRGRRVNPEKWIEQLFPRPLGRVGKVLIHFYGVNEVGHHEFGSPTHVRISQRRCAPVSSPTWSAHKFACTYSRAKDPRPSLGAGCTIEGEIQSSTVESCQIIATHFTEGSASPFLAQNRDPPTISNPARSKHPAFLISSLQIPEFISWCYTIFLKINIMNK
jgi:hypothetical protein